MAAYQRPACGKTFRSEPERRGHEKTCKASGCPSGTADSRGFTRRASPRTAQETGWCAALELFRGGCILSSSRGREPCGRVLARERLP
jgi:hypothetical protein